MGWNGVKMGYMGLVPRYPAGEGKTMRGKASLAIMAILLGTIPIEAQVRRVTVRRAAPAARPVLLPNHTVTYVHPARPPVRMGSTPVRVIRIAPQRPVATSNRARLPVGTGVAPIPTSSSLSPNLPTTDLGGTPISLGQLLNPAPGLGFDFSHLAAINSDLQVRALIDPVTQMELRQAESLPREQPAAFWPAYGESPVVVTPSQPQVILVQQPVRQLAPQPAPAQAAPAPMPVTQAAPAPPLPDVGQFLLVREDGKVIRAVAFSEEGQQIVYITAKGMRRTVPLGQINVKATEQRNAEHGTILHLAR